MQRYRPGCENTRDVQDAVDRSLQESKWWVVSWYRRKLDDCPQVEGHGDIEAGLARMMYSAREQIPLEVVDLSLPESAGARQTDRK